MNRHLILTCLLLLMLFGCGSKGNLKVVPVSGKLTLKKSDGTEVPLNGAKLVLVPFPPAKDYQAFPAARVADDGTFVLGTYADNDGAPEGEYTVTIEWKTRIKPKKDLLGHGEVDKGPDKLNGLYTDAAKSPLRAKVVAGQDLLIVVPSN